MDGSTVLVKGTPECSVSAPPAGGGARREVLDPEEGSPDPWLPASGSRPRAARGKALLLTLHPRRGVFSEQTVLFTE